jgi:SAM-dependent methyltransferase
LLRRPHRGKGAALSAGLASLTAPYAGFCDVDLSTPLEQFERIVDAATRAPVLAIGSRDLPASELVQAESPFREALGRSYNRLLQATVTPGVVDTQCGAKVAARAVWERLLPACREEGFAWDAEVVAVAIASRIEVREVPIEWRHDERSHVNVGRDGAAMVFAIPRIWKRARSARTSAGVRADDTVFEGANAAELAAADRTHWWFRSKAALVSTALRRTGSRHSTGWLVDAGGGAGGVTAMLGWDPERAVVAEASDQLVSMARSRHGLLALRGSVTQLPLARGSVDVLCLLDVIEHLPDPRPALAEAARVVGRGGRVVINVPAHPRLWSEADVVLGHHRRYLRATLTAELDTAGLEPELLTHVFSWLVPPVWLKRRFAPGGRAELGLDQTSMLLDRAALALTTVERLLMGRVSLPFGTSVLCVARVR